MVSPKTELKFSFYFVLITYFNMKLYRIMAGKGVEIYQKKKANTRKHNKYTGLGIRIPCRF